jgi:hypothetical protein
MSKKNEVFVISAPLPDNMTRNDIKRLKKYIKQELIAALIEFVESEAQPHKTMLEEIQDARAVYQAKHKRNPRVIYLDVESHNNLRDELYITGLYNGVAPKPPEVLWNGTLYGMTIAINDGSGWWVE